MHEKVENMFSLCYDYMAGYGEKTYFAEMFLIKKFVFIEEINGGITWSGEDWLIC